MNKKYLSAVLFGALLASTTGTFTSCKDYDDDINGLSERVDAVEKTLAELNTKFGALAYVKSVSFANGVLTVTDQNGTPSTYTIPDTDTNTTYTVEVGTKTEGNSTAVTITLKGSDGSTSTKIFTLTDKDTVITDTTLDPTLFWMDETTGEIWYGPKDKKDECTQTGVTIPKYNETTVLITDYVKDGATLGWDIKVNDKVSHLNIQDVLPITGFEWMPEVYYNGIEAVEFPTFAYNIVKAGASADTTYVGATATLSTFPGVAYFHVNPASATIKQIKGEAEGAQVLYKSAVNHTTRGNIGATATIDIDKGVLAATIAGDMNKATTTADELDMLALQLTTTAGNTFTTGYFAVYNKKEDVSFSLVDKDAFVGENTDMTNHKFATKWSLLKAQSAIIDADNMPEATNSHLVQAIQYDDAIAGVDLNTLFKVAMTKKGKAAVDFDWAANKLAVEYTLCKYDVDGTDQIHYAKLNGSILTAVNYEDVNLSCIGKTPVVKITVKDTNNDNVVIAVSYIKLLYVGNKWDVCEDYTADVAETKTVDWTCFKDGALDFTTTVQYMSTKVYPMVGTELGLDALSKKEFATVYTFSPDFARYPKAFQSRPLTALEEIVGAENNADNRQIKFDIDEVAMQTAKDGEYKFYAIYQKNSEYAVASSKYRQYPNVVAIPYIVKVQNYPTTQSVGTTKAFRIGQAWIGDTDYVVCKGSKQTVNGVAMYLDMAEAINFTKYGDYALEIDPEWLKIAANKGAAVTGDNWYTGGNSNWIVLKKQLVNDAAIEVPVNVYKVLCNNDKIFSDKVYVKFQNPASISLTTEFEDLRDAITSVKTGNIKSYIVIKSSKDGSVLYQKGAVTEAGKVVLGNNPSVELGKEKDGVVPAEWFDKFTWTPGTGDNYVSWLLDGQNTLAQGKTATCKVGITVTYGKVTPENIETGKGATPVLGGGKLTTIFTVNVLNPADYDAKYNK